MGPGPNSHPSLSGFSLIFPLEKPSILGIATLYGDPHGADDSLPGLVPTNYIVTVVGTPQIGERPADQPEFVSFGKGEP